MFDTYIEIFFTIAATCNSLLFVPQIIRLFKQKDSKEISFITFFGFNVINVAYLLHGVVRSDELLIVASTLSVITNTTVTLQILYYRYMK